MSDYKLLFINNPKSSNSDRVRNRVSKLEKRLGHKIKTITSEKDLALFADKFARSLSNQQTLVLIGGGDGTVHQVVEATIKLPIKKREKVVLFPIWGGNANDFANMLNGLGVGKNLLSFIKRGEVVSIHPLQVDLSTKETHYAICYASFGASAYAADILDKKGPARLGRFHNFPAMIVINETISVLKAFLQTHTFKANVNGQQVEIFEQAFTNGSRWAKVYKIPLNLTEKKFYKVAQPTKNPAMLIRIFKLLTGKRVGEITDKPAKFTVEEAVLAQYDGEVSKVPANTTVKVCVSDKNVFALSTKNV